MLRVQRFANGQVMFKLSGRIDTKHIAELESLLVSEGKDRRIVLDLKDITLVNGDAVSFLDRCETDSIMLKNCPAYIRVWITRQRTVIDKKKE
jgi:hypothetical protein